MGLKQDVLERQLALAKANLEKRVKALDEKNVPADQRRNDPTWRGLNAVCRKISRRLAAVSAIAERDSECERRKQESESGGQSDAE